MKLKILALLGALAFAAPVVAEAAPAGGITANSVASVAAPQTSDAAAPGDTGIKPEKVWWRGRGWGWRGGGWGWRRGWGWRGYGWRGYGWGWRRPYWRRYYW